MLQPSTDPVGLLPLILDWKFTVSMLFDPKVPTVCTEKLVLPCRARFVLFCLQRTQFSIECSPFHNSDCRAAFVVKLI